MGREGSGRLKNTDKFSCHISFFSQYEGRGMLKIFETENQNLYELIGLNLNTTFKFCVPETFLQYQLCPQPVLKALM